MYKNIFSSYLSKFPAVLIILALILATSPAPPVLADDTGWNSPVSCTSGLGQWTNPGNALVSDNVDTLSNAWNEVLVCSFNLPAIPAGHAITGIEVSIEGSATGAREANVDLSWNGGGFSYTTDKITSFGFFENTFTLGDTSDTWGRTWSASEFTSANFRVRLTSTFVFGASTISLDHIQVRVTHILPPEMDVEGNGNPISDGDTSPDIADGTDWGTVNVGNTVTHTFTIYNNGIGDLTLSTPVLLGPGANLNYSVSTPPGFSTIPPGGFTTFDISFSPTPNFGPTKNATVSIANNDPNESPYTFAITGTRPVPEIDIQGNGISIADGDGTPSFTDGTQWGFVGTGISVDHTFTIFNTGDVDLNLSNARITGATISFSVLTAPAATVAPGESTTVVIRFSPSALGGATKDAVFLVDTNDPDEDPYNFDLQGIRSGAGAEVEVQGNGLTILDGDATPSTADGTDFGNVNVGSSATHTYTIYNYGPDDLTIGIFTFTGNFSLVSAPASTIPSGGFSTFDVQFTPGGLGTENGTISFENNDAFNFENPYDFSLSGTGVDSNAPAVTSTTPANGSSFVGTGPSQFIIEFSEDVKDDGSAGAANNPANYLLVEDGANSTFDTLSCAGGLIADDTLIAIDTASYTNNGGSGPFVATLNINGGVALPAGSYRLYVCGTTSVEDLAGNELNGGQNDTQINFTVLQTVTQLPATGFPQGQVTALSAQPAVLTYASYSDLWLEIPKLGLKMSIVGVPQTSEGWNVSWLDRDAGWLNGSAFPTWSGNSVITAHVWDALNQPGPFAQLKDLQYGDQVKIHAFGQVYTYEIRATRTVLPTSINSVFKHEEKSWITLVTCEDYKERSQTYSYRRMVQAVLISVTNE